jgi:hypothetical protein
MLAFLPFLVWIMILLLWLGRSQEGATGTNQSIRSAVILASICWGAGLAITSEILNLFNALTTVGVGLVWGVAIILLSLAGLRHNVLQKGIQRLSAGWNSLGKVERLLAGGMVLLSGVLLLVILSSLSGNNDSLLYHLSRVAHWAQNGSLQHYATGSVQQLYNPVWAEVVILHLRLLWGNDQLAGLVQWSAMLVSIATITQIASELGVGRGGQWIVASFAFSLPMGIAQSISTQNDYVVAVWLLCVAWLCLRVSNQPFTYLDSVLLGSAVGLGLLTKGTFYPYAVPFAIWFVFVVLRRAWQQPNRTRALRKAFLSFGVIAVTVFFINCGYWLRNLDTFDTPLGPSEWVSIMTAEQYSLWAFTGSLVSHVLMNFATPSEQINSQIAELFRNIFAPLDPRMNQFNLFWGWNHEDMAGNPLHVILLGLALLVLLLLRKYVQDRRIWVYLASGVGSFSMFALIVHFDLYAVRYQLPLFLLFAPLAGASLDLVARSERMGLPGSGYSSKLKVVPLRQNFWWVLAIMLLVTAIPYTFMNRSRPVIALKEGGEPFSVSCLPGLGCTMGSILFEPPMTSLFANQINLRDSYLQMSDELRDSGCQQVGLRIDSHDFEYLFWWLLDAPQSGVRMETLYTFPELERYIDPSFKPCAIICTICEDRTKLHGLPLTGDYSTVRLFSGSGFTPEPGPKE